MSGFVRGLFVGTVIGTVSSMVMRSDYRNKAKEWIRQGGQMLEFAEEGLGTMGNMVHQGQNMFKEKVSPQMSEMKETFQMGKEKINQRVEVLEKRLEELEKGY
ncbi:MAG: hypothetical protein KAX49_14680 [Halanaerobiales bacterium]|nr:hypothetical protein [Halanaerobiales bacterium]